MKKALYITSIIIIACAAFIVFTRSGGLSTDRDEAIAAYGGPPSQFLEVDGAVMHYRDEGEGPPLILLHGSRASLHQWDGWVEELKDQFRIIRVDGAAHGFSQADANDDYSPDRQNLLLAKLLDHLEIDSAYFGGTSSGSTQAVRFAAQYPERVQKLTLSTVPLKLPARTETPPHYMFIFWLHNTVLKDNSTDLFWRTFLVNIYADPAKVTDELVTRYRILNGFPDQRSEQQRRIAKWYELGGPEYDFKLASKVKSPVFVQWGVAGPVLPKEIQCEITTAFTNTDVRVISYPLGHKLVMEDPVTTARDAARFLNGENVGGACERN